jgi:hypothetical protein
LRQTDALAGAGDMAFLHQCLEGDQEIKIDGS